MIYRKGYKISTWKLLEMVNNFSKVLDYNKLIKINILSIYQQQTCRERDHETLLFIAASKKIKSSQVGKSPL